MKSKHTFKKQQVVLLALGLITTISQNANALQIKQLSTQEQPKVGSKTEQLLHKQQNEVNQVYQEAGAASDSEVAESLPGSTSEVEFVDRDIPAVPKNKARSKLTNATKREEESEQVAEKEQDQKTVKQEKAPKIAKVNNDKKVAHTTQVPKEKPDIKIEDLKQNSEESAKQPIQKQPSESLSETENNQNTVDGSQESSPDKQQEIQSETQNDATNQAEKQALQDDLMKEEDALAASEEEAQEIYENAIKAGGDPTQIGANAIDIVDAQKQAEDGDALPSGPPAQPASHLDILAQGMAEQKTNSASEIAVEHTLAMTHAQDQSKLLEKQPEKIKELPKMKEQPTIKPKLISKTLNKAPNAKLNNVMNQVLSKYKKPQNDQILRSPVISARKLIVLPKQSEKATVQHKQGNNDEKKKADLNKIEEQKKKRINQILTQNSKRAAKQPIVKTAVKEAPKKAVMKKVAVQPKVLATKKAPSADSEPLDAEAQAFEAQTSKLTNRISLKQSLKAQTVEEFDTNTKNLLNQGLEDLTPKSGKVTALKPVSHKGDETKLQSNSDIHIMNVPIKHLKNKKIGQASLIPQAFEEEQIYPQIQAKITNELQISHVSEQLKDRYPASVALPQTSMLLQLKESFVGDFDYDKEEFADPKEIKAEGDLVKEAVQMVNRGDASNLRFNYAKESADLIKYDLEENEEKRSEKAPGESEDATQDPIEKLIDDTATNKEQAQETMAKNEHSDSKQTKKATSEQPHIEEKNPQGSEGAAEEKKKQAKVVKEIKKIEKPKQEKSEKEREAKGKNPDQKDNTPKGTLKEKSLESRAAQAPSQNDVAKILDEVHQRAKQITAEKIKKATQKEPLTSNLEAAASKIVSTLSHVEQVTNVPKVENDALRIQKAAQESERMKSASIDKVQRTIQPPPMISHAPSMMTADKKRKQAEKKLARLEKEKQQQIALDQEHKEMQHLLQQKQDIQKEEENIIKQHKLEMDEMRHLLEIEKAKTLKESEQSKTEISGIKKKLKEMEQSKLLEAKEMKKKEDEENRIKQQQLAESKQIIQLKETIANLQKSNEKTLTMLKESELKVKKEEQQIVSLSAQAKEAREKAAAAVAVPVAVPSPYLPLDKFDEVDESKTAPQTINIPSPIKPQKNSLVVQQINEALKDILEANSAVQAAQDKQKNAEDALKKVKLEIESPNTNNSSTNDKISANATAIPSQNTQTQTTRNNNSNNNLNKTSTAAPGNQTGARNESSSVANGTASETLPSGGATESSIAPAKSKPTSGPSNITAQLRSKISQQQKQIAPKQTLVVEDLDPASDVEFSGDPIPQALSQKPDEEVTQPVVEAPAAKTATAKANKESAPGSAPPAENSIWRSLWNSVKWIVGQ